MEWNGSTTQTGEGQRVGNPDTGAVFIRDDVNDEGTTFQLNMYDCWFEMNSGYTFRNYPVNAINQTVVLNFTGCLFHFWDVNRILECLGFFSENAYGVGVNPIATKVSLSSCISALFLPVTINSSHILVLSSIVPTLNFPTGVTPTIIN